MGTYGGNVFGFPNSSGPLKGGVFLENDNFGRPDRQSIEVDVSDAGFQAALAQARSAAGQPSVGRGSGYYISGDNCVDFARNELRIAGAAQDLTAYLNSNGTLVADYAFAFSRTASRTVAASPGRGRFARQHASVLGRPRDRSTGRSASDELFTHRAHRSGTQTAGRSVVVGSSAT